jgi:hypothetical protein
MSSPSAPKKRSFPWGGILVGGIVLAILVGLSFPTTSCPSPESAKRAQAAALMHEIRTAVFVYNAEYNTWPVTPSATRIHDGKADGDIRYETKAQWEELTAVLSGNKKPSQPGIAVTSGLNPRNIQFLQLQRKNLDGDAIKDPSYPKEPSYFVLIVDANQNNVIKVEADPLTKNLTQDTSLTDEIAIYSRGGATANKKAAITSW